MKNIQITSEQSSLDHTKNTPEEITQKHLVLLEQKIASLRQRLYPLDAAAVSLQWSYDRCLALKERTIFDYESEEKTDSLIARFCRMKDVLFPILFVLCNKPEFAVSDSVLAHINYARQQGIVSGASDLILIHDLCHSIKNQFPVRTLLQKRDDVLALTPVLLAVPAQLKRYLAQFLAGSTKVSTASFSSSTNSHNVEPDEDGYPLTDSFSLQEAPKKLSAKEVVDFYIDFSSDTELQKFLNQQSR